MTTTINDLENWLSQNEDLNLEFKKAQNNFSFDELCNYCSAISNENGGKLILGIEPKNQNIIGTSCWNGNYNTLSNKILEKVGIRVDVEELTHPKGRVLIFHIRSHITGKPTKSNSVYWMRAGESLVAMDESTLKNKLTEFQQDFSASFVGGLGIEDLDVEAINNMRLILEKKNKHELSRLGDSALLNALELIVNNNLTIAALVLLGKKEIIDKYLPSAEIIFEWRQDKKINHDFRKEWREPFLKIFDTVWDTINSKNLRIPIQQKFFQGEVFSYNEKAIRESLLNAVTHRDYKIISQSIIIKADSDLFIVTSPGGFILGITPENIIDKQGSRNRRIAEVFQKLGLVERSGQGVDQIFSSIIQEGKGKPDYLSSDSFQVVLRIPAKIKDKNFILFLDRVYTEKNVDFSVQELYELESLREKKTLKNLIFKDKFLSLGIIEKNGNTRGIKYMLSHRYYLEENKTGVYTRLKGFGRDEKKNMIISHLKKHGKSSIKDFKSGFADMKSKDVDNLFQELRLDNKIKFTGSNKTGLWEINTSLNQSETDTTSNRDLYTTRHNTSLNQSETDTTSNK